MSELPLKQDELLIEPQPGPQYCFLSSPADIIVYGGSAGGGKSYGLLIDAVRYFDIPGYNATIFRRTMPEIRSAGGLWDTAVDLYSHPFFNSKPSEYKTSFKFDNSKIDFRHLEHLKSMYLYQGSQLCYIGFDELTSFLERQFWYLVTRNRSMCDVKPCVRATCNPDPDSWVKKLISWWLDPEGRFADKSKSGIIRYLVRQDNEYIWFNSMEEALQQFDKEYIKSVTFIPADIYDNQILLEKNPEYLANLNSQDIVTRQRLLKGDWKIKESAGLMFKREWFPVVSALPNDIEIDVRAWDTASTVENEKNKDPDFTAGVRIARDSKGCYYVIHSSKFRESDLNVEKNITNIASQDTNDVDIIIKQEPGSAGKSYAQRLVRLLPGYYARAIRDTGDKITRAKPFSAQCEAGNVKLLRGDWNDDYLTELENFPNGSHDDQVDASATAFERCTMEGKFQTWDDTKEARPRAIDQVKETQRERILKRMQERKEGR